MPMKMATSIERWPLGQLLPYARNARTLSDEQVAQIAASIKEFGFVNPILVGPDRVIIAGHGRLLAARKLGMTEVPVIVIEGLTENQRRALVLAHNKLTLNAGWDEEMLRLEIDALRDADYDLDLIGFDDQELADLLARSRKRPRDSRMKMPFRSCRRRRSTWVAARPTSFSLILPTTLTTRAIQKSA